MYHRPAQGFMTEYISEVNVTVNVFFILNHFYYSVKDLLRLAPILAVLFLVLHGIF